ncbi:MAG: peptide deformylase [Alphaproteobacteria bacterium]|nr:peptide deformylase [Alphaproteobacteria bacterium]
MTRRAILEDPDPRLRLPSEPVDRFDASLAQLVEDLCDTLYAGSAIGLSAPQIDDRRRVLVMDLSRQRTAPQVFVNPTILSRGAARGLVEESCLSLPGVSAKVMRAVQLRAAARDAAGRPFERDLADMEAVCLQHEMDHLDGVLFTDRLSLLRRLGLRLVAGRASRAAA